MRADAGRDVEISGRAAAHAGLAFAGNANALAGLGAGRNDDAHGFLAHNASSAGLGAGGKVDAHGSLAHNASGAAASRTWVAGNLPGAAAARAGLPKLHRPFGYRYRAAAFALGAGLRRRAWLSARAAAGVALRTEEG